MSKNAEGWIRHRGGKCPVEAGVEVSTRHRDGKIVEVHHMTAYADASAASLKCVWSHKNDDDDIMAYRLHKTVEQAEACGKPDPRDSAKRDSDYVYWVRDRITEIDAITQALTTKRADLVQKLAGEGFALIGRVVDMSDSKKWMVGDLFTVNGGDGHDFEVGDKVVLIENDGTSRLLFANGGVERWVDTDRVEFHSRPSA